MKATGFKKNVNNVTAGSNKPKTVTWEGSSHLIGF